jgi:hypothetical protein
MPQVPKPLIVGENKEEPNPAPDTTETGAGPDTSVPPTEVPVEPPLVEVVGPSPTIEVDQVMNEPPAVRENPPLGPPDTPAPKAETLAVGDKVNGTMEIGDIHEGDPEQVGAIIFFLVY